MEPLEDLYFQWLCAHVQDATNSTPSTTRWNLLRQLHSTQYVWVDGYDENRAEDGVELRTYFGSESQQHLDPAWEHLPCSVLEFMVALSARAEFNSLIMEPADWWFWHLIDNLGIDYPDATSLPVDHVSMTLEDWMFRQYGSNGHGGLFPLQSPNEDQRYVETWYQLMAYLEERGW